ncbi:hypothetical protein [Pontibacter pamirensis]|uniref:hypothetical protein n=1 Tax=Pontibacter pamirensis TaxID=2562824 RepID=UPI0013898921|nr:hypothetical protein [Pontibacter pamirensis]
MKENENRKDDRATLKVPHSTRQKVTMLAAALSVPMYQAIDDLVSQKLAEMGVNIKDKNTMTQRDVIDAMAALAEVVKVNREIPGSESIIAEANEKIKEFIPLLGAEAVAGATDVSHRVGEIVSKEELAAKYGYSVKEIELLIQDALAILKDVYSDALVIELLDMVKKHKMNLITTKHLMLRDLRRRESHGRA